MYVVYKYIYEKWNEYLLFLLMFVIANYVVYTYIYEKWNEYLLFLLTFVIANVCRL